MLKSKIKVVDDKLERSSGPLAVVDRNVLSFARLEDFLPPNAEIVLPDAYFHEMAGAQRDEELAGFVPWIRKYGETVWIARYWWELIKQEERSAAPLHSSEIISEDWTKQIREHAPHGEFAWPENVRDQYYDNAKQEFIERSRLWTKHIEVNKVDMASEASSEEQLCEFLRHPQPIVPFIQKWYPDLQEKPWSNLIGVFPDRLAICRWWRLVNYYTVMHSLGYTSDFENNWEDAQYAFTASYVGRLATQDRRLIDLMRRIFPKAEIFSGKSECTGDRASE